MKRTTLRLAAICSLAFTLNASAAVLYVDLNSTNPLLPYADWSTAATNIQDAVDAANPGDQVLVTNGVYQNSNDGGNRVTVHKPITVKSVNGPEMTVIDGAGAMRCVHLANGAALSGFTLKNGCSSGDGGGVWCQSTRETVSNCVVAANLTQGSGSGGGAYSGTLNNCVITGNSARLGGGVSFSTLNNCTIVGNYAMNDGGGTYYGNMTNCIIYYNAIGRYSLSTNNYPRAANYCCTTPHPPGSGNITNAPAFVDLAGGNFRLQIGSPCINAGTNASAPAGPDLDGNLRIVNGTVDMGAYENQYTSTVHYVSLSSTNPAPPYTNWITAATNIQDAVGVALASDSVVADAGVYNIGGTVVYGQETNRVALTNAITLLSVYGPQMTTIVGGTQTRCVYVGSNAALSGFTITNGYTRASGGDVLKEESGGGIWCEASGLVTDCLVVGNSADINFGYGGGMYGGVASNCTFTANSARHGGGVYSSTLYGCTVSSNGVVYFGAGDGGGANSTVLYNCTLNGNSAFYNGGGAYQSTLYNCTLTGNQAVNGEGGGAYGAVLYNCTLSSNSAYYYGGGGASVCTLYNCTLEGNHTRYYGGGTYYGTNINCVLAGNVANACGGGAFGGTLYNCTVSGNQVTNSSGSGGGVWGGTLSNCIVYNNSAPVGSNWIGSPFMSYCCTTPNPDPFNWYGNITNNPQFVDPVGGMFRLKCGSPCIDAGTDLSAFITNDLVGNLRPLDGNGDGIAKFDMGAYEYNPAIDQIPVIRVAGGFTNFATSYPVLFVAEIGGCADYFWWDFGDGVTVTNQSSVSHAWTSPGQYNVRLSAYYLTLGQSLTATTRVQVVPQPVYYVDLNSPSPAFPYTNWTMAAYSIQQAIAAGTTPGRLILVTNGVYYDPGVIIYGSMHNSVALTNPVVVQSVNGPDATIIQPYSFSGRCAYVGANAILSGFTLTGGHALPGGDPNKERSGGGVWCEPDGMVSNCVVAGNQAYVYGGGAYQGTYYDCVFTNNSLINPGASTPQGGGVFGGTLYNCTIISNLAKIANAAGGGASQCLLYNCILTGNLAKYNNTACNGGGVNLSTLYNCTVSGNTAYRYGGGANLSTLYGCTLAGNSSYYGGGGNSNTFWNCVLTGNLATNGGGAYASTLHNCLVSSNQASSVGGGLYHGTLYNCTVANNTAMFCGGFYGNYPDMAFNSIIYGNTSTEIGNNAPDNWQGFIFSSNCCSIPITFDPSYGNITGDPVFMDAACHLAAASPCRGAGSSLYAAGTDMDGEAWNSPPSMGADEVYDADFIGALSVAIQSPRTNLLVNRSLALTGQINGRAAGLEWSFDDGTILTNVSYFTSHAWTNAGDYSVVFTAYNPDNPGGVSTNLVIHVLPLAQPWLEPVSFSLSSDGFQFQFNGQADAIYTVQVATNLVPPIVWQDLQTITSTGGVVQVTDPNAPNAGTSFYRVGVQ